MSDNRNDDLEALLRQVDLICRQIEALVARIVDGHLTRQQFTPLLQEIDALSCKLHDPDRDANRCFAEQLAKRQGTTLPDFKSFYDRKAEFDKKLFGASRPPFRAAAGSTRPARCRRQAGNYE